MGVSVARIQAKYDSRFFYFKIRNLRRPLAATSSQTMRGTNLTQCMAPSLWFPKSWECANVINPRKCSMRENKSRSFFDVFLNPQISRKPCFVAKRQAAIEDGAPAPKDYLQNLLEGADVLVANEIDSDHGPLKSIATDHQPALGFCFDGWKVQASEADVIFPPCFFLSK